MRIVAFFMHVNKILTHIIAADIKFVPSNTRNEDKLYVVTYGVGSKHPLLAIFQFWSTF